MNSKLNNNASKRGLGLGTIIFLIFLVLKLAGIGQVATWSWIWVCSPLWIPIGIIAIIFLIALFVGLVS